MNARQRRTARRALVRSVDEDDLDGLAVDRLDEHARSRARDDRDELADRRRSGLAVRLTRLCPGCAGHGLEPFAPDASHRACNGTGLVMLDGRRNPWRRSATWLRDVPERGAPRPPATA